MLFSSKEAIQNLKWRHKGPTVICFIYPTFSQTVDEEGTILRISQARVAGPLAGLTQLTEGDWSRNPARPGSESWLVPSFSATNGEVPPFPLDLYQ